MAEYLLTLSFLGGFQVSDMLGKVRGVLSEPLVLIVIIGLAVLLLRARVR